MRRMGTLPTRRRAHVSTASADPTPPRGRAVLSRTCPTALPSRSVARGLSFIILRDPQGRGSNEHRDALRQVLSLLVAQGGLGNLDISDPENLRTALLTGGLSRTLIGERLG